ncbi:c-type cytochrome [Alcaligenaceae bacterium]|nr:c-type cytochrome [Alcaligenaceae bacterium]
MFELHRHNQKIVPFAVGVLLLAATSPSRSEMLDLAKSKACMACHTVETKVVGPAYKDIAAKEAGIPGAAEKLAKSIRQGSSGVWGVVPMPPNAAVSEAEAKKLADWILSLK